MIHQSREKPHPNTVRELHRHEGRQFAKCTVTMFFSILVISITLLSAGCAEEEVVDCFRIGLDRYCVKVASSTKCTVERVEGQDQVRCTDKNGNISYPGQFLFDDGNIWLPE